MIWLAYTLTDSKKTIRTLEQEKIALLQAEIKRLEQEAENWREGEMRAKADGIQDN